MKNKIDKNNEIEIKNKKWKNKPFISLVTLFGFITMSITGLVLILVPQGRIAYWTNWQFLGLSKTQWGDIHITTSLLFLAAGIYHTYYNWRSLINYIISKITGSLNLKKELYTALLISIIIVISGMFKLPPLSYILRFNDYLKDDFWLITKDYEPPFGHAEELSLKGFCKKLDIDLGKAESEFQKKGIKYKSNQQSLQLIAKLNNKNAMQLYLLIKKYEPKLEFIKNKIYTSVEVEQKFAGKGYGNKSLKDVSTLLNLDLAKVKAKLKKQNISISVSEKLKINASNNSITTMELLKAMLIDNYKVQK